jgi:hypothetical protein
MDMPVYYDAVLAMQNGLSVRQRLAWIDREYQHEMALPAGERRVYTASGIPE